MYEIEEVILTTHSYKKAKERIGIPRRALNRNAERAWKYGVERWEAKGRLKDYLDSIYYRSETADNLRVYNRYVYLFAGHVLITILHMPKELIHTAYAQQQNKRIKIEKEYRNGKQQSARHD